MAIRNESFVGQPTELTTQILKNGIAFVPSSVVKVEIFGSLADAQNNTNIIQTITTGIIHLGNGVYQYTANPVSVAKTYYDKFYFIDTLSAPQQFFISNFIVNQYTATNPIDTTNKAYITGKILNSDSTPARAVTIEITPKTKNTFLKNSNALLTTKPIRIKTNQFGEFGVYLYLSSISGTSYEFVFKNANLDSYNKTINVPDSVPIINFENA